MTIEQYFNSKKIIEEKEYEEMIELFGKNKVNNYFQELMSTTYFEETSQKLDGFINNIYLKNINEKQSTYSLDTIKEYFRSITEIPLLSKEEEYKYTKAIKETKKR